MMKLASISVLLLLLILVSISSCKQVQKVTDIVVQPTERQKYARNFVENDSIFQIWKTQYELRKYDSLKIPLPYVDQGSLNKNGYEALSYDFEVLNGERLVLEMDKIPDTSKIFVNIFKKEDLDKNEDSQIFQGLIKNIRTVVLENGDNAVYKVIIQPELHLESDFIFKVYTEPTYAFPVAGKTSKDIQSFWGSSRDGGKRSHEGIDIFAKRGTPVVAVVEGRVRKTGNHGLGGKQIWIREGLFGNSLYYAHLDSIAIITGTKVKIGDTLGFVGNTGNARTTAPHLHFGVYQGYKGAINPLPFIKQSELLIYTEEKIANSGSLISSAANIRIGPGIKYDTLLTTKENLKVTILSKSNDWFQIVLPTGARGFIHQSLIREEATDISI